MTKLDEIALNIELVLISIVEGVALMALGENAVHALSGSNPLPLIPYELAGLCIILVFWSQAISHAVSFIRWPLRAEHMFLYFVAAFLQILAYGSLENLPLWFLFWTLFSILTIVIYIIDLRIIRHSSAHMAELPNGTAFVHTVEKRHRFEMKRLVPTAVIFNAVALYLTSVHPEMFSSGASVAILGSIQLGVSLVALYDCMKNFNRRGAILTGILAGG